MGCHAALDAASPFKTFAFAGGSFFILLHMKIILLSIALLMMPCLADESAVVTPVDSVAYYDSLANYNYQRFRANENRFWCLPLEALQIVMVPKDAVGEMLFWTLLRLPLRFWSCLLGLLMEVLVSRKSDVSGISIITTKKKMNFWSSENQKKLNPSICRLESLPC